MAFGRTLHALDTAAAWLEAGLAGGLPVEEISADRVGGRVAARRIVAPADWPQQPIAALDGFALAAEAAVGASLYAPASLPLGVGGGSAVAVALGEPLPEACDCVVGDDVVRRRGDAVELLAPVAAGSGVLPAAAELARGAVITEPGDCLTALDGARFAACGIGSVTVRSRPVVGLLRRGGYAGLDGTGPLLADELARVGAVALREATATSLPELVERGVDLLLLYGGSGWSADDDAEAALAAAGGVCDWHGCALNPGASLLGGRIGPVPVLGLPGGPWPAFAAFRLAVRPLLARLAGGADALWTIGMPLGAKITSSPGLTEYVPVSLADGRAVPLRRDGLLPPVGARGVVRVSDGSEGFPRGATVLVEAL